MIEKLKIHDGDTPGKTFEVKQEYPKPKVATMSNFKPILTIGTNELEIDWEYPVGIFQQLDDRYLKQMLDALNYFIYLVKQEQMNRQDRPTNKGDDNE